VIPRPRINLILYHGVLPFDVAQGTPSMVEGWGREPRGPSTLLRTILSDVEGWRPLVIGFGNTADATPTAASTTAASVDRGEPGPAQPDPSDSGERRPPRGGARL